MQILWTAHFSKRYRKANKKIKTAFDERVVLFGNDQFHPLLDNHPLKGVWRGYRSINVTGDWRVIFKMTGADSAYFVDIGTHHDLYGR